MLNHVIRRAARRQLCSARSDQRAKRLGDLADRQCDGEAHESSDERQLRASPWPSRPQISAWNLLGSGGVMRWH
jgi:hypothetical protein